MEDANLFRRRKSFVKDPSELGTEDWVPVAEQLSSFQNGTACGSRLLLGCPSLRNHHQDNFTILMVKDERLEAY